MNKEEFNNKIIEDAVNILNDNGVIIVPTDTVYGIAVRSDREEAKKKIYSIKKRNTDKRLPIIVDTYERLLSLCDVDEETIRRFHPFFPGKLTIILKKRDSNDTVAIRMINNEIINKIIEKVDVPLALTSANISGEETSDDVFKIIEEFDGLVDMVIMGNKAGKISSTIVELKEGKVLLVREGSISFKEIENCFYRG